MPHGLPMPVMNWRSTPVPSTFALPIEAEAVLVPGTNTQLRFTGMKVQSSLAQ
jgi:hypothetical protein